jgi:hypothetical protein
MKPLEEFPCENHIQQQIREQYWLDKLLPTMNMNKAYIEDKVAYKAEYYAKWLEEHPTYHKEWRAKRKDERTLSPEPPSVPS